MKYIQKRAGLMIVTLLITIFIGNYAINLNGHVYSDKPVQLIWYTIGEEPKDIQLVQDEANKYLEEKINVNINIKFIDYTDYTARLSEIMNSGEEYDLAFTSSWAGDYFDNARAGEFLELNKYLETTGKHMKEIIDDRFWNGATIDGKVYAIPNQKELGVMPMWAFTKEYVDKYNIPYKELHSLEDLEPWLKLIKENEPNVIPLYMSKSVSAPQYFDQLVDGVGVEFRDITLTVKNMFETEKMKSTLETLRRYYEAGYINSDAALTEDNKEVKRFVTKGDGQPYAERLWSEGIGYEIVTSPIMDSYITNSSSTGSMIAVSKTSKNPQKAVEFLNLLNTDEYLRNLINYGIEGIHYEKIGENQIKLTDNARKYSVGYYTVGNLFLTYVLDEEPIDKWEEFKKVNDESGISPTFGFEFDPKEVKEEVQAINNIIKEFEPVIYSGSVDIEVYLKKLNLKLKEQGIDKVIVEMQRQIDNWVREGV